MGGGHGFVSPLAFPVYDFDFCVLAVFADDGQEQKIQEEIMKSLAKEEGYEYATSTKYVYVDAMLSKIYLMPFFCVDRKSIQLLKSG